ncbi:MAG: RtcB family protein, partial [Pseudomonadota bacterium]
DDIESTAMTQLTNIASLPFVHHHVAGMPDVHAGVGATVGSVIPTEGAIIPAAVGVDIGCGMNALRLSLDASALPDSLRRVRVDIEAAVPVGFDMHKKDPVKRSTLTEMHRRLDRLVARHPAIARMQKKKPYDVWVRQTATLGGGNHFIELCLDEDDNVWVMLQSGSRGIGNIIGRYFISLAKKDLGAAVGTLPDKDLAYLREGTAHFEDYIEAVDWAQDYAYINRREMMRRVLDALKRQLPVFDITHEAVNCHHNYVAKEHHFEADVYVTRKGAVSAQVGELGIIPGSMGARSYIVRGRGSAESFHSCAHGAGRRMSRAKAKRSFTTEDLAEQTEGIECRKDPGILDEIPGAYKDIDDVMSNQSDLVEIVHTLRQVVCIKG